MQQEKLFFRLRDRYFSGDVPWDDPDPPPEVMNFVPTLKPGRAIDLGCGYGRASIYMARLGWDVDGIDFIPEAISVAANRAMAESVVVRFHIAAITDLDFLRGPYDFALDVGCCHNLDDASLEIYRNQLLRLIRPGGFFMLFARLREMPTSIEDDGPYGLDRERIEDIYPSPFKLVWQSIGETVVGTENSWSSGWFRFRIQKAG